MHRSHYTCTAVVLFSATEHRVISIIKRHILDAVEKYKHSLGLVLTCHLLVETCELRRVGLFSNSPGECNVKFVEVDEAVENRVCEAVRRWLKPSMPHATRVDSRPPFPLSPSPPAPSCRCIKRQSCCHRQGQQEQERNAQFECVTRQREDLDHHVGLARPR